ncbi:rab-like protein 2A [Zootermopsis nevadensis]|uniref:Rab-like protein 2A n=1 Tax=Zootermopsis nevadensis TaxID=136037 RepID=A0A067QP29_ZOONE|nr:rab-like protein 2A [Zootermopsis nevadensis]KDR11104.1 Rab-like protein 2A [Zootermopsis nevadensis]
MAGREDDEIDYDDKERKGDLAVKVICLGDSAVGKSKLVERFLLDGYKPQQHSTYALTLFRYPTKIENESIIVDFWDTAGQEMFQSMHPSYYHQAHACILVFDATRKVTYKNLATWYQELRQYRPHIPVFCAANKIDANMDVTQKAFAFPQKHNIPLYYVSASDGTNVVKLFRDAIQSAVKYKKNPSDVTDQIIEELERI